MSTAEKIRRNSLWNEFTDILPAIVREFNRESIDIAIDQQYDIYMDDMEQTDVIAERNTANKRKDL